MKFAAVIWSVVTLLTLMTNASVSWGQTAAVASTVAAQPETAPAPNYACPMHKDVTAAKPGACSKCGMELKPSSEAITEEFIVKTATFPPRIQAGQPLKLRFSIFHPKTGAQVKQFNVMHEKLFHLFVISHDFSHFEHLHPTLQPDGSFTLETALPQAGLYHIFCDIFPVGGVAQVVHQNLVTAGFKGDAATLQAQLTPDQRLRRTIDGIHLELDFAPQAPLAGQSALLRYRLTDTSTGQPLTDLQPYLGAWGHTLILSEDAADYLHSHPLETQPTKLAPASTSSPATLYFETFFPRPGNYRIWSQFQRNQKLVTVSFNVSIGEGK